LSFFPIRRGNFTTLTPDQLCEKHFFFRSSTPVQENISDTSMGSDGIDLVSVHGYL